MLSTELSLRLNQYTVINNNLQKNGQPTCQNVH